MPELVAAIQKAKTMAAEKPTANTQVSVTGTVHIAPALANQLPANATLFVYARAAQGAPIPIAIVRASVKDLPFAFTLDDTTAPMPNETLSQEKEVVLVARISKSGDAKAQAGDLQGVTDAFRPSGVPVDIEINELVQ
jgi:cytochrome c-type biogenesis protein CcmH